MSKTPADRITKQMGKLGVGAEHLAVLQGEYDQGRFAASKKGDGKAIRDYIRKEHPGWVTVEPAAKEPKVGKTPNPWGMRDASGNIDPSTINLTEQARIYKTDKGLAERLAKAAGTPIGSVPHIKKDRGSVVL